MAVDDVWSPPELLYSLKYSAGKEYGSFSVILEELAAIVAIDALAVEIVLIINEIYLDSGSRNRCNLDHKRSVDIVDDDIHSREADHLMKLVLSLVDASISWHEGSDLLLSLLDSLRKVSADVGYL